MGGGNGIGEVHGSLHMPGQTAPAHPVSSAIPLDGLTNRLWLRFLSESLDGCCKWHLWWEGTPHRRFLLQNPVADTIAGRLAADAHTRLPGQAHSGAYTGPNPAVPGFAWLPVPRLSAWPLCAVRFRPLPHGYLRHCTRLNISGYPDKSQHHFLHSVPSGIGCCPPAACPS